MGRLKISVNYPIYRIKKSINISHGGDQSGSNRTIRKYHDSAGAAPAAECNTENRNGQHGCDPTTVSVAAATDTSENNSENTDSDQKESIDYAEMTKQQSDKIKKAVEQFNKNLSHSSAIFGIHEATNRVTIKIVDKDTKEVIKEVPPEETLDMIAKVWEIAGILVDKKL